MELNIKINNSRLQFQASPMYLGIKLNRGLTFRHHLEALSVKTTIYVALIHCLACTTWGASTKTSCISTQALVCSAAEYSAQMWCWSSHIKKLVTILNNALRTISGCLHATPFNHFLILASIPTPTLRRETAVLALSRKAINYKDHLINQTITETPKLTNLESRRSFSEHAHQLLRSTPLDTSRNQWLNQAWIEEWKAANPFRQHWFVDEPGELLGEDLPRK